MAFWDLANVEPKRTFRYIVTFPGATLSSDVALFAQKVSKPSFKVTQLEYQYLNHKFKYPGRVEWEDITIEFVDAGGSSGVKDMASTLSKIINDAGYYIPKGPEDVSTIGKQKLSNLVGEAGNFFTIQQINAAGNPVEVWQVFNPMFMDMKFSDLSYDTDEISKVTVTVKYDYAILNPEEFVLTGQAGTYSKNVFKKE